MVTRRATSVTTIRIGGASGTEGVLLALKGGTRPSLPGPAGGLMSRSEFRRTIHSVRHLAQPAWLRMLIKIPNGTRSRP